MIYQGSRHGLNSFVSRPNFPRELNLAITKMVSLPINLLLVRETLRYILNQEGPSRNKSVYTKNWPPKDKMAVNLYFTQPTTHFIEA